jgi:hypothetical protein
LHRYAPGKYSRIERSHRPFKGGGGGGDGGPVSYGQTVSGGEEEDNGGGGVEMDSADHTEEGPEVGLCTLNQVDPWPIAYSLSNP